MEGSESQKPNNGELKPQSQIMKRPEGNWLNGLKDRFSKMLGLPKVKIDIFYSPHGSAKDIDGLEDQLKKADILIPEEFGWSLRYLNALRRLSSGELTPKMALEEWGDRSNPYYYARDKRFFGIIYNSKKPIAFLDIPDSHSLVRRQEENKIPNIEFGSNFGQVLESVRGYIEKAAGMQEERETYMLEQLQPQVQELLKTYPELRRRQEVNILLDIGAAHTLLYRYLRKDYQTTRKFGRMPMIFRYTEEALRRHMLNKPVDNDLVARIATEWTLSKAHKKLLHTSDSLKDAIAERGLVSRFSFDELKKMFEGVKDLTEWEIMFVQRLKKGTKNAYV